MRLMLGGIEAGVCWFPTHVAMKLRKERHGNETDRNPRSQTRDLLQAPKFVAIESVKRAYLTR